MVNSIIKHRRGNIDKWRRSTIVPEDGELIIVEFNDGSRKCKVGDGYNTFNSLRYVDDATRDELLEKFAELEKSVDTKVSNASKRYEAGLAIAKEELALQVIPVEEKLNKVSSALTGLENSFNSKLAQMDQQKTSVEVSDAILASIDGINKEIADLIEDDVTITNKVFAIENSLTEDIRDLKSTDTERFRSMRESIKELTAETQDTRALVEAIEIETEERLEASERSTAKSVEEVSDRLATTNSKLSLAELKLAAQSKRIDNFVSLADGSTTGDAELIDARIGYDGVTHESAGAAIRSVGNAVQSLTNSLSQYIDTQAVDGLHYDTTGEVGLKQPYMLYLTSAGNIIQDSGVKIISGAAGGGVGGGGSGDVTSALKINYITPQLLLLNATNKDKVLLRFNFSGTDYSGDPIAQASATWKVNGVIVAQGIVKDGENQFDITEHVKVGTITVQLYVTYGNSVPAEKLWYVKQVELAVESAFDDTRAYPANKSVIFDYKPHGAIEKTAVFRLNGQPLDRVPLGAEVSGSNISYELPALDHGTYLLEVYLEDSDGATSNHIYKDIIYYNNQADMPPVIGCATQSLSIKQYATTNIVFTAYDPLAKEPTVNIEVDGTVVKTVVVTENKDYNSTPTSTYSYTATTAGAHTIKLICGSTEKVITVQVEALGEAITPVTTGLAFDFNPAGKSNEDTDRLWTHNGVHMRVSDNFDWTNGGYIKNDPDGLCFCIKAGSTATIDYKLFADEAKASGKELKLVFKTKNVSNPDAVFLSCVDNTTDKDTIGLVMGVHTAHIYGKNGNLELAYSENDAIEFEFNIAKDTEAIPMVMGYEDGVPSRPMVYDSTYSFKQNTPKEIVLGSPDCDLYVYRFKVYNRSLSDVEILNNFIADARTVEEMLDRQKRNQIYDENHKLNAEVLAEKCPWLRVYKVSAPHFTSSKSDKVPNTTIQQIYKGGDPVLDNWIAHKAQHSGQGTSSNNYGAAGRNLDFIMNKSDSYFELGDGSIMDAEGNPIKEITLTRNSVPVAYLNAKVNIASSNNLTNAILANRFNKFKPYTRNFVREEGYDISKIKDTMEFHNCVIFIQETDPDLTTHREFADTDWHFYAIGNIGDSKKTDNTRLTDMNDPYECCVEIMDVDLPLSAFPRDTMMNAMGTTEDEDGTVQYTWAKNENLGILYEATYALTQDTKIDLKKTYYIELEGKKVNAMGYTWEDQRKYLWATDENLGLLYELKDGEYSKTDDTKVDLSKTYFIKVEDKDDNGIVTATYFVDAMSYTTERVKTYTYATQANLAAGKLYEISYHLTEDTEVDLNKTYFVDILEHDDFSEAYTYGWRYISDDEDDTIVSTCKQAWIDLYRFVTTSSDEEFKANLANWFMIDSALYDYLFTTRYCMVDNRAKNTFWHYSKTGEVDADGNPIRKWDLCWDYDNDTALGLNNFGKQVYRYGLEDIDYDESGIEVFRQSDSLFFCRIRDLFSAKLKEMYQTLESQNAWKASTLLNECDKWQEQFPEELWRLDIERKYLRTYSKSFINGSGDKQFLTNMANGRMKYHRRQWERDQEMYMASKYQTPTALGDGAHANFRVNRFNSTENLVVKPSYQFTLTPYAYMYLNVKYSDSAKVAPVSVRAVPNVPTVVPYLSNSADIINVGSAASITDFGDLSALYAKTISIQHANRVKKVKIGNSTSGYENNWFASLTTGSNDLLEELDITNVTSYASTLDLSKLINLKKLHAFGTNIPGVIFAQGGKINYVELPAVNSIELIRLNYLSSLNLTDYNNVVELTVKECPLINQLSLFELCPNLAKVNLDNINFGIKTYKYFVDNVFKIKDITITGTVHINSLDGQQFNELKSRYPNLKVTYNSLDSVIKFIDTDLTTIKYEQHIANAGDCIDPTTLEGWANPAKVATQEFTYEWFGWAEKPNTVVNYELLSATEAAEQEEIDYAKYRTEAIAHVEGDRTLYPVFKVIRNGYEVQFRNPTDSNKLLYKVTVPYGRDAAYVGETPKKLDVASSELYSFTGWSPSPENITGPLTCYAQFAFIDDFWYTLGLSDITYTTNSSAKTLSITECDNDLNKAVKVPETFNVGGANYSVTSLKGFSGHTRLELIDMPETVTSIQGMAFQNCDNLSEVTLHNGVESIGSDAFRDCNRIKEFNLPASLISIGDGALAQCPNLTAITVANGNTTFKVIDGCLVNTRTGYLVQGLPTGVIPQDGSVTALGKYCFSKMGVTSIKIPSGVTLIPSNAFSYCDSLTSVELPDGLEKLDATCFAWCDRLASIELPASLKEIMTYVFSECPMETVRIPAAVQDIREYAFGKQKQLTTVTFEKRTDASGNIIAPDIDSKAFAESGSSSTTIVFNVPWSEDYYLTTYPDTPIGWGAKNYSINYNYEEAE